MAASLKGKRTPITTPPYQVPSVDVTPDPPIFSLVTTFKRKRRIRRIYFDFFNKNLYLNTLYEIKRITRKRLMKISVQY